jgi:hypothetical protein
VVPLFGLLSFLLSLGTHYQAQWIIKKCTSYASSQRCMASCAHVIPTSQAPLSGICQAEYNFVRYVGCSFGLEGLDRSSALLQRSGLRLSRLVGSAFVRLEDAVCGSHRTRRAERASNVRNQALAGCRDPTSSDEIPQCFEMFAGPFCEARRAAGRAASKNRLVPCFYPAAASAAQCCAARSDLRRRVSGRCARHVRGKYSPADPHRHARK